ncbi:MAG: peptidase [Gemmatimonadetes bacterium]|jgi:acetylornithine deacetylase/succinyl-diaminopimelate desuccinylase-like protein|nr:peptidase [Gemmatimonadota bacterium]
MLRSVLLQGLLVATVLAPQAAAQSPKPPVAPGPATLTPFQRLAREVYEELVEINTVDSGGSTTKAAEAMAARFRAAGMPAADIAVLAPEGKPAKGNLVVRYRGRAGAGAPRPLLLLAHLDVVAANRSDWPRDPFVLHEEHGYFLGRGTADDKAMAAMFVASLLQMKREGTVPDRDLILALTADEEGGDANGVEFLLERHRALVDAAYSVNEGGGGTLDGNTPLFHSVQAAEKVPVNFTLTATNPGGHSSVPRPDNAIYALATALTRIAAYQFPVALNEVTRPFFANTALVEPRPAMAAAMRTLAADPASASAAATLSADPRYASMLRTSCVATRLAGGHAYNALPQHATANVNCRIVPTSTADETRAALQRVIGDTGIRITFTVEPRERFGVAPTPVEPELLAATTRLTARMWGAIPIIPTMSTGATDGRFLRAAGIPTYGVSGIFSEPGETNAHGRDEKLRVKSFYDGLAFLDALVRELAVKPKA